MRITEINIVEFGCLKGKLITPDAGLNVIYGENESGKSTVQLFIKFMLYGLGRRSASNTERERSVSWSGHTAAGSMSFVHGEKSYRIERRYTDGGRESLTVTCLDSGERISTDKTPGEYFLGVPREVFESSACVGQGGSARIDGEKTAAGIRNMLTSADESVDTAKILKSLDSVRVAYRHKNKNGGSLYDDEQRMAAQRQRLEKAREASLSLDTWQEKLEAAKRDYEIVKQELEAKDALLGQLNRVTVIKRFERLRRSEEKLSGLEDKRNALINSTLKTDFLPSRDHTAELRLSARSLGNAEERFERAELAAERGNTDLNENDASLGEQIEQKGGPELIIRRVKEKKEKSRRQNGMIAAVWVTQAVLALCGAALLMGGFLWAAAFFSFVIPAVIVTVNGAKTKKRLRKETEALTASYGATSETLESRLAECVNALADRRRAETAYARADAELMSAKRELETCRETLETLLKMTQDAPRVSCEAALAEHDRLEIFISEHEGLCREQETLSRMIETERASLSDYDEAQIRRELTVNIDEVTPTVISEAERVRSFLAAKKSSIEQRVGALNSNVIQLRMNAEDPLPIADGLCALEEKYNKDREFYEALTLAMESIEQAGQAMSGSVTPLIAKRAGEIMSRISANRYTALRTTGNLGVSLDSDGFGIKSEYLSAGTRDAAYLALRIALLGRIYGDNTPPLILDEALCQLDDVRAESFIAMLSELADSGLQCICFTSHKREQQICDRLGAAHTDIML